jgi:hypothetical protein
VEVAQLEPTTDAFGPFLRHFQKLAFTLQLFTIDAVAVPSYNTANSRTMAPVSALLGTGLWNFCVVNFCIL